MPLKSQLLVSRASALFKLKYPFDVARQLWAKGWNKMEFNSSLFYHTLKSTQAESSERPCGHLRQLLQVAVLKQYQT